MVIINIDDLCANINYIKAYTKKELMAVVKSDAYGLGAKYITEELCKLGVNYFFVNTIEEYLKIKDIITTQKVLVMESVNEIDKIDNIPILTINSLQDAINYAKYKKKITVHFQIDIGMNRLGFRNLNDFKKALDIIINKDNIIIDGIYTHYPSAFNKIEEILAINKKFSKYCECYNFNNVHSTSTKQLHHNFYGNMVRVGMAMYGYGNQFLSLKPVVAFYDKFINIFSLSKDDFIGYRNKKSLKIKKGSIIGILHKGYSEINSLKKIYYQENIYKEIATPCMNHRFYLIDDKINYHTNMSLIPKNDTILLEKINWYHLLVQLCNEKKIYIKRINNESKQIFKRTRKKSGTAWIRKGSNQIISSRTIRFRWGKFSCSN